MNSDYIRNNTYPPELKLLDPLRIKYLFIVRFTSKPVSRSNLTFTELKSFRAYKTNVHQVVGPVGIEYSLQVAYFPFHWLIACNIESCYVVPFIFALHVLPSYSCKHKKLIISTNTSTQHYIKVMDTRSQVWRYVGHVVKS